MTIIYKLCELTQWHRAEQEGRFLGAAIDLRDGYIHFSTAAQVVETAAKHFAGVDDLVLVAIEADALGPSLRWEPSRGGDLFPHLYATLPLTAVHWVEPLHRGPDGRHVFPDVIFET